MVSTLMLGVPWQDCVELKSYPFFLCITCVDGMALAFHRENQGSKSEACILDHLHMVMFMSINLNEAIESFKAHGRRS